MTLQRPILPDAGQARPDPRALRTALGCFPTGVAIVTTTAPDGAPVGLTISSFNTVSLDPPLVLWSLGLGARSLPVFRRSGGFAVNVLAADQAHVPSLFSGPDADRFAGLDWRLGALGFPVIAGAAALFECADYARYPGGDHEIFLGEVCHFEHTDTTPLVFGKGRLVPLSDAP